ncbi:uncharacterized protein [Lepeophtheirus salmonis]|uniref:Putative LOC100161421 [Acyrthosiphon pisum] n=1 Tax=Lepeophtheirus salmonis TaxID=72036 RepID=A0A0K2T9A9_LEPSM|nr:uncharacterized protein LOC121114406 isoform X1 [Lepeophtheirus salmonis]
MIIQQVYFFVTLYYVKLIQRVESQEISSPYGSLLRYQTYTPHTSTSIHVQTKKFAKRRRRKEVASSLDSSRKGRFFNLFTVVRFLNLPCLTSTGRNGTCFADTDCEDQGGVIDGVCASGYGVCCRFTRECGEKISENGTIFKNPISNQRFCNIIVQRASSDICQIKLDFEVFEMLGPNFNGECDKDFLAINNEDKIPRMCGSNTGEHIIIPATSESLPIQLAVILDTTVTIQDERVWKIRIHQYECTHPTIAPTGCLQYYVGFSGHIKSFNYRAKSSSQHLWKQSYSICIRVEDGYCGITYSQLEADPYSFTLSSNGSNSPSMDNGAVVGERGCRTDYITIPGGSGMQNKAATLLRDRYCGTALGYCFLEVDTSGNCLIKSGPVVTFSMPFIIGVQTDSYEGIYEGHNHGFSLNYHQLPCKKS